MAAELRVDTIKSRAGINTLNFAGDGLYFHKSVGIGTTITSDPIQVGNPGKIAAGIGTFRDVFADGIKLKDGKKILLGTLEAGDCQIIHDGTDTFIQNKTGDLKIANNVASDVGGNIIIQAMNGENSINCVHDAQVELSYNGTKKLETTNSGAITSGIHTVTVGTDLDGYKVEEGSYDSNALNGEFDFELENGHIQTHTGSTAGNYFPDFRVSSSQSLSSVMDVGDVVSCTLMVASSSHYCTTGIKIDNSTSNLTIEWVGGSAPSAANGSGYDIYGFTIQKTAATPAYLIIGNAMGAA